MISNGLAKGPCKAMHSHGKPYHWHKVIKAANVKVE
jgi:hypothetical protein